jgi:hypothetical protein
MKITNPKKYNISKIYTVYAKKVQSWTQTKDNLVWEKN